MSAEPGTFAEGESQRDNPSPAYQGWHADMFVARVRCGQFKSIDSHTTDFYFKTVRHNSVCGWLLFSFLFMGTSDLLNMFTTVAMKEAAFSGAEEDSYSVLNSFLQFTYTLKVPKLNFVRATAPASFQEGDQIAPTRVQPLNICSAEKSDVLSVCD